MRKLIEVYQGSEGRKLQWTIIRKLSRWRMRWLATLIPPRGPDILFR
jgi:hypothetical protein